MRSFLTLSVLAPACMAALFSLPARAQAGVYFYVADLIPVDAVGNCESRANAMAEQFTAQTGNTVTRSRCGDRGNGLLDIRLTYSADDEASLVTTDAEVTPDVNPGLFDTRSACEAALAEEKEEFALKTGLQPLIAYCKPENENFQDSWIARIDSFGTPTLAPYYVGASIGEYPVNGTLDELKRDIGNLLENHGVEVRRMNFSGTAGSHDLTIFYYSARPVSLRTVQYGELDTAAQCAVEEQKLGATFARAGISESIIFCGTSILPHYGVWGITVDARISWPHEVNLRDTLPNWDTCNEEREDLLAHYNATRGRTVYGLVCTRDILDEWSVSLVEADWASLDASKPGG